MSGGARDQKVAEIPLREGQETIDNPCSMCNPTKTSAPLREGATAIFGDHDDEPFGGYRAHSPGPDPGHGPHGYFLGFCLFLGRAPTAEAEACCPSGSLHWRDRKSTRLNSSH